MKLLTTAFANDAIPVDEFERRVADVYRAGSVQALEAITRDLPEAKPEGVVVPALAQPTGAVARRPQQKVRSILSSVERNVPGPMPERLDVQSIMGSLELDLRRAEFPSGVTEIVVEAILGNIEIDLPEHVVLEDDGHAFLGNFSVRGRSRPRSNADAPVVMITARSSLANLEIDFRD